jgi:hypothetical protein
MRFELPAFELLALLPRHAFRDDAHVEEVGSRRALAILRVQVNNPEWNAVHRRNFLGASYKGGKNKTNKDFCFMFRESFGLLRFLTESLYSLTTAEGV